MCEFNTTAKRVRRSTPAIERVLDKVEIVTESGCWIFMGALNDAGYGIVGLGGRGDGVDRAHRVTYRHFNGDIPEGLFVCHRCDVPSCCNPHHLFPGTPQANHDDMRAKKRHSNPPRNHHDRGEHRYNAKLTETDVIEIKRLAASGMTGYRISKIYPVCMSQIYRVLRGEEWRHVA